MATTTQTIPLQHHPLIKWAQQLCTYLVLLYAALLLTSTLLLWSGFPISNLNIFFAVLISTVFFFIAGRKLLLMKFSSLFIGFSLLVIAFLIMGWINKQVYDLSYDGRTYHQKAISYLEQGWNPFREEFEPQSYRDAVLINHYPRGSWLAAAAIYKLTGEIETGKITNFLLIGAVFFASINLLLRLPSLHTYEVVLISIVVAANPVGIYQSFSYYVDGQGGSAVTLMIILLLTCLKDTSLLTLVALASTLVLGLNIKFTTTTDCTTLAMIFLLVSVFARRTLPNHKYPIIAIASGLILGFFVVGFTPYVTNLVNNGHPFYPVFIRFAQPNKAIVLTNQMPSNFENKGWAAKLFISTFSPSENPYQQPSSPLKWPFIHTQPL